MHELQGCLVRPNMENSLPNVFCGAKIALFNHACCRTIYQPRGRVLGGSSSINGMIYARGHAFDFDRWDREGATGWSYADCLPYFKKSETYELGTYFSSRGS